MQDDVGGRECVVGQGRVEMQREEAQLVKRDRLPNLGEQYL